MTTASGCFRKVNQTGGTTYPAAGWSAQDAQSLDAVSAVCPNCHILLVEALVDTREIWRGCRDHASLWNRTTARQPLLPA